MKKGKKRNWNCEILILFQLKDPPVGSSWHISLFDPKGKVPRENLLAEVQKKKRESGVSFLLISTCSLRKKFITGTTKCGVTEYESYFVRILYHYSYKNS